MFCTRSEVGALNECYVKTYLATANFENNDNPACVKFHHADQTTHSMVSMMFETKL